jgi:uncharacterized protein YbjQ (UPF0145 family)
MEQILLILLLPILGLVFGSMAESRHYTSIREREEQLRTLPAVNVKRLELIRINAINGQQVEQAVLVTGSAVISVDYFKRFLAAFRNFFGGRIRSYESLLDRARREAILRMKATAANADLILNTRIETSTIGKSANQRKIIGSVEAIAYGTAVTFRKG